jgi:hypothetical protein
MSFEFDPNENIDRAEDDNDPQDIESLGGEGLFGRVIHPDAIAENMTTKRKTTGFWLKWPGDGEATSFF